MKSQGAFRLCLSHPPQKAEKYQNSPKIQLCSNKPLANQLQNLPKSAENTGFAVQQSCHLWNERERARALLGSNSFFPFSSLPHSNCALHCIALCIAVHCWGVSVVEALPVINIIPALSLFPPTDSYWLLLTAHFTLPLNCTEVKMPRTPTGALLSRLLQCTVRTVEHYYTFALLTEHHKVGKSKTWRFW